MSYIDNYLSSKGGFDFSLHQRNNLLTTKMGMQHPGFTKTGTTIVGVTFNGGVVLAADTRATAGSTVADKNCLKLHNMAPNIWCAGAGTAADLQHVTNHMAAKLKLQRYNTGRESRVNEVVTKLCDHLFNYQGHVGAHLIIGGADSKGVHLCAVSNGGNYIYHPFAAMGSGSLAALGILESKFQDNLTRQQAIDLCIEAIEAGIFHDLGSGSNVDYVVLAQNEVDFQRNVRIYNKRTQEKQIPYVNLPDNTPTLKSYVFNIENQELTEDAAMELEIIS